MGDSLDADLEVTVEDSRGLTITARRRLTAEGSRKSMGVSGEEILMGPLVELLQTAPHRVIDEMTALGDFLEWGTRPDEAAAEGLGRVARNETLRRALGRGMGMDLSDLPIP